MTTTHTHHEAPPVTPAEQVLHDIAAAYYAGCQSYHAAGNTDSPDRVFWRIRLITLADVGDRLAAALDVAAPDWQYMQDLTRMEETPR